MSACPLCGSTNYTKGAEHREILQPAALPEKLIHLQGNVRFVAALCEDCGASFNLTGLSDETRIELCKHEYAFIKPSTGVGAANYEPYISLICKYLGDKSKRFAEIGGYDGYTPKTLSDLGYTDLALIDPSPNIDQELIESGKFKLYKGFFPDADPVWQHKDEPYSERERHLYDMITAKDVLQMLDNPQTLVNAVNISLKKGGYAIFSSGDMVAMHPQQKLHLCLNAYKRMARVGGFSLVESYKPHKNSTVYYVFRKEVDLVSDGDEAKQFCSASPWTKEEFEQEQNIQREIITRPKQTSEGALKKLKEAVTRHHNQGHEIIIYGTGYTCSELMDNIDEDLDSLNLTIINSSKEEDGYLYMRPDDKITVVHYAGDYLKNKHVPLIVLAIRSQLFKQEIEKMLSDINCQCDELLYLYG